MVKTCANIVSQADAVIGFEPFGNEPNIDEILKICKSGVQTIIVSKDAKSDPVLTAQEITHDVHGENIIVLVPGQRFDARGTRHGRGGGWYDRFLRAIPSTWIRIGISQQVSLSSEPLVKYAWDEVVDFLFIREHDDWKCVETHARQ